MKLIIVIILVPIATNCFIFFIYDNELKKKAELLGPHERLLYEKFFVTENLGTETSSSSSQNPDLNFDSSDEDILENLKEDISAGEEKSIDNNYDSSKNSLKDSVTSGSGLNFSQSFLERNKMKMDKKRKSRMFDLENQKRKRRKRVNSFSMGVNDRLGFHDLADSDDKGSK